jgi:hypothetical protein
MLTMVGIGMIALAGLVAVGLVRMVAMLAVFCSRRAHLATLD